MENEEEYVRDEETQRILDSIPKLSPEESAEMQRYSEEIRAKYDHMYYKVYPKRRRHEQYGMWHYFFTHERYSRENYEKWKKIEPEIDFIMDWYATKRVVKEADYIRMGRTDYDQIGTIRDARYAIFYQEPKKRWWEFWKR